MNELLTKWNEVKPLLDRVLSKLDQEKEFQALKLVYMYLEGVAHKITDAIYSMDK